MEENQYETSESLSPENPSFASDILGLALMPGFTLIGIVISFVILILPFLLVYYLFFSP